MRQNEDGMVTAFVVVVATALLLVAGLVIDGGSMLAARRQAINEAEAASRSGAQALDVDAYRSTGVVKLDSALAQRSAQDYIAATGDEGDVSVLDDEVTVTIRKKQTNAILGLIGMQSVSVSGTATSHAVRGVEVAQ